MVKRGVSVAFAQYTPLFAPGFEKFKQQVPPQSTYFLYLQDKVKSHFFQPTL